MKMGKLLFGNAGLVISTTDKGLKASIISKFAGESRTYYVIPNNKFDKDTDFEAMWNDFTPTWMAFIQAIEHKGITIYRTVG
jgi:hypothetical protein